MDASLFTRDTITLCEFNIVPDAIETETNKPADEVSQNNAGIHFHNKHKYRITFEDAHKQYHDFDNGDAFTYKDKYTALLQEELQNPYWCLHDPVTIGVTKYQQKWTLRLCRTPCTSQAIPKQSLKLIMSHTR